MCRFSEAELYCVNTNVRRMSEFMQFESAISTRRYLPPSGTAGLERCCVSGKRRLPAPPPRITANSFGLAGITWSPILISGGSCGGRGFARSFLCDLYTNTCADARGAGFNHCACVVETFNAARCFHAEFGSDGASHQCDVRDGRATLRKPGRCFYKIGAGFFRCLARAYLFIVSQQCGLDDDFANRVVFVCDLRN